MPRRKKAARSRAHTIKKYQESCKAGSLNALKRRRKNTSLPVRSFMGAEEITTMQKLDNYFGVTPKNTLKAVIVGLIKHDLPLTPCAHYYIGASQVFNLLSSNLTPKFTHKFLITTKARHFGSAAEILLKRKLQCDRKKTFVSTKIPFLSGTPDFIVNDTIIELKSYSHDYEFTKEMLLQVLIYMEILQKSKAEIHFYCTLKHDEKIYDVKKTHIIGINKVTSIFTKSFIEYACKGYVTYLTMLLAAQKIKCDSSALIDAIPFLIEYCEKQEPGHAEISGMKISNVCRMMESSIFHNHLRLKETKGKRWTNSETRLESVLQHKETYTSTYESRTRINNMKIPKGDMWSNYIKSDLQSITDDEFHKMHGIQISKGRNAPDDVLVKEFSNGEIYRRAITITEKDVELLYTYYTQTKDIGQNFHHFNYCEI